MAISLASLQKTKHAKPPRIVVHGAEKVGKSTFFAGAPGVVFIQTEDGLSGIDATAFPLSQSFEDVLGAVNALLTEDHEFATVCIDSADWLERLIHDRVCRDYQVNTIEKAAGGYGKGYLEANNYWRQLLGLLDRLNAEKGMIVGLICHSQIAQVSDPEHEPYDTYRMKLHNPKSGQGAMALLNEWADVIGFANKKVLSVQSKADENRFRGKTTHERLLHLEGTPAYLAGNRYGLPPTIPLSWAAFQEAFNQAAA